MMLRKHKHRLLAGASALLLALSGCGTPAEDASRYLTGGEAGEPPAQEVQDTVGCLPENLALAAENDRLALYVNEKTGEFAVEDKASGRRYTSNPVGWNTDPRAKDANLQILGSQIVVDYYDSENKSGSMNSYKDSFLNGQIRMETIDNGVRFIYQLGVASQTTAYPSILRAETMEEVLEKLPDKEASVLKGRYRHVVLEELTDAQYNTYAETYKNLSAYDEAYILRSNLSKNVLSQMNEQFKNAGFDGQRAAEEEDLFGMVRDGGGNASFLIPVEYTLDGGDFRAEILTEQIQYTAGYYLTSIRLLPYFAAAGEQDQGWLLVPDGSGALIRLDRGLQDGSQFAMTLFGADEAIKQTVSTAVQQQAYLPVFGIKTEESAVLGIVEKGAASGTLSATLAGAYTSYTNLYASFAPMMSDTLSDSGTTANTLVFSDAMSSERYAVRYRFLSGSADYTDMAGSYRDYLLDTGVLKEQAPPDAVPFYLELAGAIEKKENILGVPFTVTEPLTTFAQAEELLSLLKDGGVGDIRVRYTGWANGGLNNSFYKNASPLSALGGRKGLLALADYAAQNGVALYPDAELTYVYKTGIGDGFSPSKDASRLLNRQIVRITSPYLSTGTPNLVSGLSRYVVSPRRFGSALSGFLEDYGQFGIKGLSLKSAGSHISADYRAGSAIDRAAAMKLVQEALSGAVEQGYDLLLDGGNAPLLAYTSQVTGLPTGSSGLAIEDEAVPFYQMAVSGCLLYTGAALNMAADFESNLLKSYEYGSALYAWWMYADSSAVYDTGRTDLYALSYETWLDDTLEVYAAYNAQMAGVVGRRMTGHQQISDTLALSEFEGGCRVLVNYGEEAASYDGVTVEARSALVYGGDAA